MKSNSVLLLLVLLAVRTGWGVPLDSLSVRFGTGVSKPVAREEYSGGLPGARFGRDVPTLPTLAADLRTTLRSGALEGGLGLGIEGEVLSVNRIDETDFTLLHLDLVGAWRLCTLRKSSVWFTASGGWSLPIFLHDGAEGQSSVGGPRGFAGMVFRRESVEVEIGGSVSQVSFHDSGPKTTSTTTWTVQHWTAKVYWDWLGD
jgi:hypothetical protein